jgi:hypothetical protein
VHHLDLAEALDDMSQMDLGHALLPNPTASLHISLAMRHSV